MASSMSRSAPSLAALLLPGRALPGRLPPAPTAAAAFAPDAGGPVTAAAPPARDLATADAGSGGAAAGACREGPLGSSWRPGGRRAGTLPPRRIAPGGKRPTVGSSPAPPLRIGAADATPPEEALALAPRPLPGALATLPTLTALTAVLGRLPPPPPPRPAAPPALPPVLGRLLGFERGGGAGSRDGGGYCIRRCGCRSSTASAPCGGGGPGADCCDASRPCNSSRRRPRSEHTARNLCTSPSKPRHRSSASSARRAASWLRSSCCCTSSSAFCLAWRLCFALCCAVSRSFFAPCSRVRTFSSRVRQRSSRARRWALSSS
mmetsp:Transcript_8316/g.18157  ORF Transcript_8316/g.18157 Transcript_8316/m.18157 type:complete len:320 (+) Transcript_8316:137-1096(+)